MKLLILNGPNLNMIGIREPDIYGSKTYSDLLDYIKKYCDSEDIETEFFQSNSEGAIVDAIQGAYNRIDGIIINPAAYTHTSIAIFDALKAVNVPAVEVHLSDLTKRESYRQISYVSEACVATIYGKQFKGYIEAVQILSSYLRNKRL